jgi:integrase
MPLAPRVARAIDLAIGERQAGPIFLDPNGQRLDRHAAGRIVRRIARKAGIVKRVGPHTLRHAFITAALDAGVPLRDVQEAARLTRERRCDMTGAANPWTGTPPTSSPPSSPAHPADGS